MDSNNTNSKQAVSNQIKKDIASLISPSFVNNLSEDGEGHGHLMTTVAAE